jgi:hypothetical protein
MNGQNNVRYNNQGTNGGAVDTGIIPAEGTWYRLDISYITADSMIMTLSGGGVTFSNTFALTTPFYVYTSQTQFTTARGVSNFYINGLGASPTYLLGYPGVVGGSKVGISFAGLVDGLYTVWNAAASGAQIFVPGTIPTGFVNGVGFLGYPGLSFFALCGNDTSGSTPAVGSRILWIDYFSFIWNKGLAGSTTTDPTQSRYW